MYIYAIIAGQSSSNKSRVPVDKILMWRAGDESDQVIVTLVDKSEITVRADIDRFDQAYQSAIAGSPAQADAGF